MAKKVNDSPTGGIFDLVHSLNSEAEILDTAKFCNSDDYIGTGSYILNAAISGSLFGGLPNRRSMMFAGESGSGKSFLAASMAREAQKKDYSVIVLDSEGAWDRDFAARIGVDTTKLIIIPVNLISEVNTFIANLCEKISASKSKEKLFIILDSIGNLTSDKEREDTLAGSEKRDMTKQQQLKALFRVNGLKMSKLAIPFLIVNHVYAKQDFIGGNEVSGGCLKPEEEIITISGCKQIKDIVEGDEVLTADGTYQKVFKTFKFKKPTFKFKLEDGSEIECSDTHRFLVKSDLNDIDSWKTAKELQEGDEILLIDETTGK